MRGCDVCHRQSCREFVWFVPFSDDWEGVLVFCVRAQNTKGFEAIKSGAVSFADLLRAARDVKTRIIHSARKISLKRNESLAQSSGRAALKSFFEELLQYAVRCHQT